MDSSWFVVAKSRQLKSKPLSVWLLNTPIVLVRANGTVAALRDTCPHRGIPLSQGKVNGGVIECCYHGWKFDSSGKLVDIPGVCSDLSFKKELLRSYLAQEKGGYIWVCLSADQSSTPFLPKIHHCYPYATLVGEMKANLFDILENFLDPLHTHYIHTGIIRDANSNGRHPCEVEITTLSNGYEARYIEREKQSGILSKLFGHHITESIGRIITPSTVELEYRSINEIEMTVTLHITPTQNGYCQLAARTYLKPSRVPFALKSMFLAPFQLEVRPVKALELATPAIML